MAYRIEGLDPQDFASLHALDDAGLEERNARRVVASAKPGFPCRVSLEDAEPGERLILLNHVSHDVATPYRSSYAIYVRENAKRPTVYEDSLPPVMKGRPIAFRAFDAGGMLRNAALAAAGDAEDKIAMLFADSDIAYLHAHNAAHGCFAAKVSRA